MTDTENTEPVRDWRAEAAEKKAAILAKLAKLGVTVEATYVPFSRSRNKDNKSTTMRIDGKPAPEFSANWNVLVMRNGRTVLATEFSQGAAIFPSHKMDRRGGYSNDQWKSLVWEAENGRAAGLVGAMGIWAKNAKAPQFMPDPADVIHCLLSDSDVLNYNSFEGWANEFGYGEDSRAAEKIYRACMETALALRNGLGESTIAELRELFQDY